MNVNQVMVCVLLVIALVAGGHVVWDLYRLKRESERRVDAIVSGREKDRQP